MAEIAKSIDNTTNVFIAILVLGLVGLLFLIIYGNLSGNLGFTDTSNTTTNESNSYVINITASTVPTSSNADFTGFNVVTVHNASQGSGEVILSGNYTVDSAAGTIIGATGRSRNWSDVNLTYTSSFKSEGEQNTDGVINNLTEGANTFFTFSNVWFTLLAIVLLIIIVMAVIAVVTRKNDSSFST